MPQNTFEAFLVGTVFTIPFDNISLSGLMIICLGIVWLFSEKDFRKNAYSVILWGFVIYYGIHILSLANSSNIGAAFSLLEKKLGLLLLPVFLLSVKNFNQKSSPYILGSFVLATVLQAAYSLLRVAMLTPENWSNFYGYTGKDYRLAFGHFLGIHPTSFSIFIFLSIFILLFYLLKKASTKTNKYISWCLILLLLSISILLASRTPLVIFLTISILGIIYYFYLKKKLLQGICAAFLCLIIVGLIAYNTPSIRYRFEELSNTQYIPPIGINHTSTNIRVGLFICSLEVLKNNWILGTGIGDMHAVLNQCYREKNFSDVLYLQDYNPHNQYIQTLLALGIFGFISFMTLQFLLLKHAFSKLKYVHAAFLIFMFFCFLTDSFLEVNKGILLYAFFNAFFVRDTYTQSFLKKYLPEH